MDGGEQRLEVQRLVQDNVGDNSYFILRQRGDHNGRDDAEFWIRSEVRNQINPTDFGQHQVDQHQSRANATVEKIQRLLSVVSRQDGESFTRKQLVQTGARIRVVFHDKNTFTAGHFVDFRYAANQFQEAEYC